jgi:hypothetical protein
VLFGLAAQRCEGMTLTQFGQRWTGDAPVSPPAREPAPGQRVLGPRPQTNPPSDPQERVFSPGPSGADARPASAHAARAVLK